MKRLPTFVLSVVCLAAAAQTAPVCDPAADDTTLAAARTRIAGLLKQKQFRAVEDEFADKMRRYRKGEYSDWHLAHTAFEAMGGDPALEPLLAEWVAQQPNSYWARLLKGYHHIGIGLKKRGSAFADRTSREQFGAMEAELAKAADELKHALAIDAQSSLAFAGLLRITRNIAGPQASAGVLAEAEARDPGNLAARIEAIYSLSPRWGGSAEEMDEIVKRAKGSKLDPLKQRLVEWHVEMSKGDHYRDITREKTRAGNHYRQAARICRSRSALSQATTMAYDVEDWNTVAALVTEYMASFPSDPKHLQRRGWAHEKMGRLPEAISDYKAAAGAGEAWAQNKLGHMYMMGNGVERDLAKARQLLQSSAAQGNAQARTYLEYLSKQPASQ